VSQEIRMSIELARSCKETGHEQSSLHFYYNYGWHQWLFCYV